MPWTHELLTRRQGTSLIEVVVSTVIVAFVISAALQTVATAVDLRTSTFDLQLGPSLSRSLMSEIMSAEYADPDVENITLGPDIGENTGNRLSFDDVDDYQGWTANPPVNPDGSVMPIGMGWSREASVEFLDPSSYSVVAADLGLKRVRVTVTSPNGKVTVLETLRAASGATQRRPSADRQIVTGAALRVEMMSGTTAEASATLTKNHAVDE